MTQSWLIGRWRALAELAALRACHPHVDAEDLAQLCAEMARERPPVEALAGRSLFCALRWTAQAYAQAKADGDSRHALGHAVTALATEALSLVPLDALQMRYAQDGVEAAMRRQGIEPATRPHWVDREE